ncbi:OmpA family protein [Desulfofundulus thermobenzoicus]|uniref:OmpA family protein n=1 Tax=Desulfofundulus thermobenzoicus TaxID=29376 RepID=A0A6N7INM2_9FIRM|nr:flagellar motor protein MotB [Desulfofundulus thermobenzoicus]MQL51564.1 OmpA family protein [Desulfofundulus thermobenzoicus]HHW42700.1 flagellar motor protein MotB [Desulfotomaculum sp.]
MKRHNRKTEYGSMERWLITYADMITLLLIFFIVMYSLSQIDIKKFRYLAESLNKAMGGGGVILENMGPSVVPGISGTQQEVPREDIADQREMENIRQELLRQIQQEGLAARVTATNEERGIVVSFQEEVLFKRGSAELTGGARQAITSIAPVLLKTPNYIRIEGHTCDLPIHTPQYPSNWELSTARALTVVRELINQAHFPPQRLSAVGYGEYRPRVPNDSEEHRQLNRRVDVVILRSKYTGAEPGSTPGAVPVNTPGTTPAPAPQP